MFKNDKWLFKVLIYLGAFIGFIVINHGTVKADGYGQVPTPTKQFYVNDYAHILTPKIKKDIMEKNQYLIHDTNQSPRIVVVTTNDPNFRNRYFYTADASSYADMLIQQPEWHVGSTPDYTNGVIMVIAKTGRHYTLGISAGNDIAPLVNIKMASDIKFSFGELLESNNPQERNEGIDLSFNYLFQNVKFFYADGNTEQADTMSVYKSKHITFQLTSFLSPIIVLIAIGDVVFAIEGARHERHKQAARQSNSKQLKQKGRVRCKVTNEG